SVTHWPTWLNTTPSVMAPILARASLGRHACATEVTVVAREAVAGREVEAPVVQAAREHAVLDLGEAREVGLAVRAPTLDPPPVALEELVGALVGSLVALLDICDALDGERFEERHHELVERTFPVRAEAAREKQ